MRGLNLRILGFQNLENLLFADIPKNYYKQFEKPIPGGYVYT